MDNIYLGLLVFAVAMVTSAAVFPKALVFSRRHGIVDNPNARKLQRTPVPVFGGIVVYMGILGAGAVLSCFLWSKVMISGFIGMSIMMAIGLWDDVKDISARLRLLIEIGLVLGFIALTGVYVDDFHGWWGIDRLPDAVAIPLSVLAGVGVINAVNLIDGVDGYKYRIHVVDLKNVSRYTNEASAVNNALDYGQVVSVGDQQLYLGGNRLPNGSFDMGFLGWTSGTGEQIAAPYFQVVKTGGIDGGSYLQCYGNASTSLKTEPSCLWTTDILKKGTSYYVSAAGFNNNPSYQRITTSAIKNLELMQRIKLEAVTEWAKQGASFTTTTDTLLYIAMRAQEGKACLDNVMVCELFSTQEEALADALKWERKRVDLFREYNTDYPQLTAEVETLAAAEDATAFTVREAISNALEAMGAIQQIEELQSNAELIVSMKLPDYENVSAALTRAESAQTALEYISAADALNSAINTIFKYSYNTSAIQSPSFSATTGWNTSAGTYKGGDQRTAT